MSDFQLREPRLGESIQEAQARQAPHLLSPQERQFHIDPSLQALAPRPNLQMPNLGMAQFNAMNHFAETPTAPGLAPPFFQEENTAGIRGRAGGLDLSGSITGNPGGEFTGQLGAQRQVAPGLRIGPQITGSVNGDNGPTVTGGIGGTF